MNWIFWVIALSWIVPFILRRMGQPGQRDGRPPYQRGPGDQYGQYPGQQPGNQYPRNPQPGNQYPTPPQNLPVPPQGQLPEGQSTAPANPQAPWWQQPLPPGFPGQPEPQSQRAPQPQPRPQAQPGPAPSDAPAPRAMPGEAPEGYRAKKLAELDRQFSDQRISLEEYMKARNEIMRG